MLGMQEPELPQPVSQDIESNNPIYQSTTSTIEQAPVSVIQPQSQEISMPEMVNQQQVQMTSFEDLLNAEINIDAPPKQIMGMIGMDGNESIEYPINSGVKWTRSNPTDEWTKY